jgi:hypothetical protein
MRHISHERNAIESLVRADNRQPFFLKAAKLYRIDGIAADYIGLSESSLFPYRVAAFALSPVEGARVRELPLAPVPCDGAVLFRAASSEEAEARRDPLGGITPTLAVELLEIVASDDTSVSFRRTGEVRFF